MFLTPNWDPTISRGHHAKATYLIKYNVFTWLCTMYLREYFLVSLGNTHIQSVQFFHNFRNEGKVTNLELYIIIYVHTYLFIFNLSPFIPISLLFIWKQEREVSALKFNLSILRSIFTILWAVCFRGRYWESKVDNPQ